MSILSAAPPLTLAATFVQSGGMQGMNPNGYHSWSLPGSKHNIKECVS